jgi:hypothetical protein
VFEHVREPGFSPLFISRSHTVPNLEGDDRGFVIFEKDHLQAVRQDGFKNLVFESSLTRPDEKKREKEEK